MPRIKMAFYKPTIESDNGLAFTDVMTQGFKEGFQDGHFR
jgi:hypothetical protein